MGADEIFSRVVSDLRDALRDPSPGDPSLSPLSRILTQKYAESLSAGEDELPADPDRG